MRLGSSGLPVELEALAKARRAEPPELTARREEVLRALQVMPAQGSVRKLAAAAQALVEATASGTGRSSTLASAFTEALTEYLRDAAAPKPPPQPIVDGMEFVEAFLEAVGRGALVEMANDARERTIAARDRKAQKNDALRIRQARRGSI